MSIMELGALGEFIGSLGVIATLFYLAIQIRSNTRATKASASFEATHSWAQFNEWVAQLPEESMSPLVTALDPQLVSSDLSDSEYFRLSHAWRAMFQKLEGQYYLFKYGLLEPDVWAKRSAIARGVIEHPLWRSWWENDVNHLTYSDEFVEAVMAASPVDTAHLDLRLMGSS